MSSWSHKTHKGTSYYTNWAFADDTDNAHQGEVLCAGKVCVMAPTMRADGKSYAAGPEGLSNDKGARVADLTSGLGIVPIASKAKREKSRGELKDAAKGIRSTAIPEGTDVPPIPAWVGKQAKEFLNGDLSVYGDPSEDRSAVLVAFANEVYGTENWLRENTLAFEGCADELVELAVDCLGSFDDCEEAIADKADRILDTISRQSCDIRDEDKRRKSYNWQLRELNPDSKPTSLDKAGLDAIRATKPKALPFVIRVTPPTASSFWSKRQG